MAAVFFRYTTERGDNTKLGDGPVYRKKLVTEFLANKGWLPVGNQAFQSSPCFGAAKEQLQCQAKALQDLEDLIKWRPFLKECFDETLIIVGQVYSIDSLIANEPSVPKGTKKTKESDGSRALRLDLQADREDNPRNNKKKAAIAATQRPSKTAQPSVKSPVVTRAVPTRPARNRPMGSASKVTSHPVINFPKTPAKTVKDRRTTSKLLRSYSLGDINSNHLSEQEYDLEDAADEMTPLYLGAMKEPEESSTGTLHDFNSYHVETFVKLDNCSRRLYCANININPSERVVV